MTVTTALNDVPRVEFKSLDELWFQVSGTLCNLTCNHCFISCSPHNDSFGYLSLEMVEQMLAESVAWGVREYYFTGGEPFLNREILPILERTLEYGPATVLTNGTVMKPEWLVRLRAAEERGPFSLEFRVSIDGPSPVINDPVRGKGTFGRAMKGVYFQEVKRYEGAMPQYHVGHLDRIARIEALAGKHLGLEIAGNAYHGVGIPDCIHSGEQAAERLLENLVK